MITKNYDVLTNRINISKPRLNRQGTKAYFAVHAKKFLNTLTTSIAGKKDETVQGILFFKNVV